MYISIYIVYDIYPPLTYTLFLKKYMIIYPVPWFLPGIGKATALRLAQAGAIVIATDISEEALKSLDAIKGNKST